MPAQQIYLGTENTGDIYVDDVDVSKGVYFKSPEYTFYVCFRDGRYKSVDPSDYNFKGNEANSLKQLIEFEDDAIFYTIPDNRRITIEKRVTVSELNNTDNVGIVQNQIKSYVAFVGDDKFKILTTLKLSDVCNTTYTYQSFNSVQSAVTFLEDYKTTEVLRFDSNQELHRWLSE